MSELQDLPNKTIVEIVSSLSSAGLAQMSLVSHHFHSISQPLLYKAPCLIKTPRFRKNRPSLEVFVETLLTPGRETPANHVRSLIWHQDNRQTNHGMPSGGETTLFAAASHRLNLRQLPRTEHAEFLLLLHLLPYLQVLTIYPTINYSLNNFIELSSVLSSATPTLPIALQSLREFHCPHDIYINTKMLLALLLLPRITSIDVRAEIYYVSSKLSTAAGTSHPTKPRLRNSVHSLPKLSLVLAVPRALTHFSYSATPGRFHHLAGFTDSLYPVRVSVDYLHLDFSSTVKEGVHRARGSRQGRYLCGSRVYYSDEFAGDSLRGWNVLRSLSCSLSPLIETRIGGPSCLVDVLPGSIRELEILEDCHWSYGNVVDMVVELLGRMEVVVPVLERLAVVYRPGDDLQAEELLRVACINAGITLVGDSFCW
ncbi:hypothetical protein Q9L58_006234 [Maublancomyces gigas]|uniref:F-box domain-containing protein n=1 Tax=Discina gigas TaxID=1032678 RepID=A0ABR3GG20_9PEZI